MICFLSIHHNGQELDSVDYERLKMLEVFFAHPLAPQSGANPAAAGHKENTGLPKDPPTPAIWH
ncbi:MAG: hypothetical protein WCP35_21135 [Verrucomicrobiota bacterium]